MLPLHYWRSCIAVARASPSPQVDDHSATSAEAGKIYVVGKIPRSAATAASIFSCPTLVFTTTTTAREEMKITSTHGLAAMTSA